MGSDTEDSGADSAEIPADDNRAFAHKVQQGSCRLVEHFIRAGMPHGYYFFPHLFKQGDEAFDAIRSFLAKTVGAM